MAVVKLFCNGGFVGSGEWDGSTIQDPDPKAMEAICGEDFEALELELRSGNTAVEITGADGCLYGARLAPSTLLDVVSRRLDRQEKRRGSGG